VRLTIPLLIAAYLLLCINAACASTWEVSYDYRSGQADTINEEDGIDLNYDFNKNTLKMKRSLTPVWDYSFLISYDAKDYSDDEDLDLDNSRFRIRNGLGYTAEDQNTRSTTDYYVDWLNKKFDDSPDYNYYRVIGGAATSYRDKSSHLLGFKAAYNNFTYQNKTRETENIAEGKVNFEKYLMDGSLTLNGYSRILSSTKPLFGTQMVNKLGVAVKVPLEHFSKTSVSLTDGVRNSRMDEDSEDYDLDYDYHSIELRIDNEHPLSDGLTADTKYTTFTKDYLSGDYDNSSYLAGAGIRWYPLKYFHTRFDYYYREKTYQIVESLTYVKNNYALSATLLERDKWSITPRAEVAYFTFKDTFDKDRIDFHLSLEISFDPTENIEISLRGDYRLKDYREATDLRLSTWSFGGAYKW
jgi:hypothetical protein